MRTGRVLFVSLLALAPGRAWAGGTEFPADGVRGLGRGGARFARADDPSVMLRNPALLADLWDDQAMLAGHLLLADSCFLPTGAYGWGVNTPDVSDFGDGPVYINAPEGSTDLEGNPISGYADDPFPEVCYEGPLPFYPQVALTMKLADDLGVGVGFFPPELASLAQWGNRDGTIDTPDGRRPNPLRYLRSHLNASYFSALGAVGYRVADWIRVGIGFQWQLVVFQATTWNLRTVSRDPSFDVRADAFGRDLFIPGAIASVHLVPADPIDVAVGFKWSDRIRGKSKLDLTAGAFGTGEVFEYIDASGVTQRLGSTIPTTVHNNTGEVDNPPIWVPQLSFGVRFADRLKPRPRDWGLAQQLAGPAVEDAMATERWDIEADVIVYFNSVYDETSLIHDDARVRLPSIDRNGIVGEINATIGECIAWQEAHARGEDVDTSEECPGKSASTTKYKGQDQISLRVGGDYNVLPGVLALRAGGSYESDAQDIGYLNPTTYMLRRYGLHAGLTVRVAQKTDISIAYAHFFHREVRLQVQANDEVPYPRRWQSPEYNFTPGLGVPAGDDAQGDFDGVGRIEVPYGGMRVEDGPFFVNAGSYDYGLDVVSLAFTQHF